jgi:hypothetical protein
MWAANPETNIMGYRVYYGENNTAATSVDAGNVTSYSISGLSAGRTYFFYLTARNEADLESPPSEQFTYAVPSATPGPGSSPRVAFVGSDTEARGSWKGKHGSDGYVIVGDTQSLPNYVTMDSVGRRTLYWAYQTTNPGALERASSTNRTAAAWSSATQFDLVFTLQGTETRQVSLYCLDWGPANRSQQIEVIDPSTGTVLDSRTLSTFGNGVYLTWNLRQSATFRVRNLSGADAVVSGVFFDTPTPSSPEEPPEEPTEDPPEDPPDPPDDPEPPAPGGPVAYLGSDAGTGGSWKGTFGSEGYMIVADTQSIPAYAGLTSSGRRPIYWAYTTTDPAALQRGGSDSRLAAAWSSATSFDVIYTASTTDPHRVSIYCLDWDALNRVQRIDVLDTTTGALLDSRTVSAFGDGVYHIWQVRQSVTFRVSNTGGADAVISGVFFDGAQ